MAKQIESALVRCMDYRLTSRVNTWMEEQGIMDMCDIIGATYKGNECVKKGSCSANQAELVGITEYFQTATCRR